MKMKMKMNEEDEPRVATINHPKYQMKIVITEMRDKKLMISGYPLEGPLILKSTIVKFDFDQAVKNLCDGGGKLTRPIKP